MLDRIRRYSVIVSGTIFWILVIILMSFTILMPAEKDRNLQYYFPVVLPSAEGIKIGSRVEILGVDQGYVNYLRFCPLDADGRIISDKSNERASEDQIVVAVLNMRHRPSLYSDYMIRTKYPAIISDKIIDIRPGSKEKGSPIDPILWNSNEVLFFRKTGNLPGGQRPREALVSAVNYDDPITIVADVIHENRGNIRRIIRNLAEVTDKINQPNGGTLSLLLNDPVLVDRLNTSLRDLIVVVREGDLLSEDLRESQAPISFLETYLFTILQVAAGGTP